MLVTNDAAAGGARGDESERRERRRKPIPMPIGAGTLLAWLFV
jgi:hypothetical protein